MSNPAKQNAFAIYGEAPLNVVSEDVQQHYSDTCAIKAQQLILEKFGIHVTEEQLINEAIANGWYYPGNGTSMADVGKLLELHGVHVNQYVHGNVFNIINELAQGHSVIMGVDSGELWDYGFAEKVEDYLPGSGADHALIVSGINTDDPQNVKVVITDPGSGDLCKEYSLEQFVDAANDSDFFMVTTAEAVPDIFDPFGIELDHLPMVGNMTYSYFLENYAFLHDIQGRPVFDEFLSHLKADSPYLAANVDDIDDDEVDDDGLGDDDVDDIDDIDDINDIDV